MTSLKIESTGKIISGAVADFVDIFHSNVSVVMFENLESYLNDFGSDNGVRILFCIDDLTNAEAVLRHFGEVSARCFAKSNTAVSTNYMLLVSSEERKSSKILSEYVLDTVDHFVCTDKPTMLRFFVYSYLSRVASSNTGGVSETLVDSSHLERRTLLKSLDRETLRWQLEGFVATIGLDLGKNLQKYAQFAAEVQDELLMNAIWDANPRLRHENRKLPLVLAENEQVKIEWAFDGSVLGVSVSDNFGRFTKQAAKCYAKYLYSGGDREGLVQLRTDGEGAGIGLYMVLERVSVLQIVVQPGERTSVIALFEVSRTSRKAGARSKSFQFFSF